MSIMRKILNKFKLESTRKMEESQKEESDQIPEKPKPKIKQKPKTLDVERYAVMCNAHLEHEEEMEQYKDIIKSRE